MTFPDLPECITEGDNLEEAHAMAAEAMALHLYGMERDGDPIPRPSNPAIFDSLKMQVTVRSFPLSELVLYRAMTSNEFKKH